MDEVVLIVRVQLAARFLVRESAFAIIPAFCERAEQASWQCDLAITVAAWHKTHAQLAFVDRVAASKHHPEPGSCLKAAAAVSYRSLPPTDEQRRRQML